MWRRRSRMVEFGFRPLPELEQLTDQFRLGTGQKAGRITNVRDLVVVELAEEGQSIGRERIRKMARIGNGIVQDVVMAEQALAQSEEHLGNQEQMETKHLGI